MKKSKFVLIFWFAGLTLLSGCAVDLEGLDTLKDLAKDEKAQQAALAQDDVRFEQVKTAILKQQLEVGLESSEVTARYGKPVSVISVAPDSRWVYKGESAGLLGGPKIYLHFDAEQQLKSWECVRTACGAES